MTWTPDSPPPCPLCGTRLAERAESDGGEEGGLLYAYLCPACRWEDAGSYDYQRLTVAAAPWTRGVWAELVLTREERDAFLAQVHALCDARNRLAELVPLGRETGDVESNVAGYIADLVREHGRLCSDLAQAEAERDILAARGGRRPLLVWDTLLKGFQLSPADRTTGALYTVTSDECAFYGAGDSNAGVSSGAVWSRACASMGEALRVAVEHAWDHGYEIAPLWNDTEALREKCDTLAAWVRELETEAQALRSDAEASRAREAGLMARIAELEAPGECQSVHKLRAALADLVEAVADAGPVTATVAPVWDRACAVLSAGWREGQEVTR